MKQIIHRKGRFLCEIPKASNIVSQLKVWEYSNGVLNSILFCVTMKSGSVGFL